MIDETCDLVRLEKWKMFSKLPYQLTAGVTATREGLVVGRYEEIPYNATSTWPASQDWKTDTVIISWPDAAERLRYQESEPWCGLTESDDYEWTMWCETGLPNAHGREYALHRLAAILCDDADAFRVLHWCVKNLGGEEFEQ